RPDTDSGVAANGPSMAYCSSIGIHADCPPNQRQDSAFTQSQSMVFAPPRQKSTAALLPYLRAGLFVYNDERCAWECSPERSASASGCSAEPRHEPFASHNKKPGPSMKARAF
ncbi:hypothetical protein, partial [Pseudomonas viridiflava]